MLHVETGAVVADEKHQFPVAGLHTNLDARDLPRPREAEGVGREAHDRLAKKRGVGLDGR